MAQKKCTRKQVPRKYSYKTSLEKALSRTPASWHATLSQHTLCSHTLAEITSKLHHTPLPHATCIQGEDITSRFLPTSWPTMTSALHSLAEVRIQIYLQVSLCPFPQAPSLVFTCWMDLGWKICIQVSPHCLPLCPSHAKEHTCKL